MLSYQHGFHAGNLADVQKHALLCVALDYLTQKDKPLSYIETHAGRGLYDLGGDMALKTGEAAGGILRLEEAFGADHPYRRRLAEVRVQYGEKAYPGSPMLAALSLRETDTMHLAELHPQEHGALNYAMGPWGPHIQQRDGMEMALAVTPPTPRRGLMLIDPSWEVKEDYVSIPKAMGQIARKWNVGILMLWYPILQSGAHVAMLRVLEQAFPEALRHEVRFPSVREGHGMLGSGMFVVNAPWGLAEEADRISGIFKRLG
ncbi:23S rRNA (adenine(2030)-N(6))-methyltransferase RlmJ [Neogemmobacter tilapiae]|uniref:Ribosomal RNA large subunit methyltransferase J n=1 Tax=Neogemmobacter tilapiae TaxID=875041 RepID=A0A918TS33_9RHOB|nr:23S rRNA (adenine(2030)-N(6))-methyltransferase RlmJ [Gemmobacter tilapiae]GHC59672.1 ribosomal RNA large subunit methyltransferase J [Gemmobacter tilapiae]